MLLGLSLRVIVPNDAQLIYGPQNIVAKHI